MSIKAMALVCTVFAGGEATCVTEFYPSTFTTMRACNEKLIQWRYYELPRNKKIVLDDCIITNDTYIKTK
tara:strand:+ start:2046 stop:2255 length:210 start_codon:yes stop_codon:yes gene_type:complete